MLKDNSRSGRGWAYDRCDAYVKHSRRVYEAHITVSQNCFKAGAEAPAFFTHFLWAMNFMFCMLRAIAKFRI